MGNLSWPALLVSVGLLVGACYVWIQVFDFLETWNPDPPVSAFMATLAAMFCISVSVLVIKSVKSIIGG